MEAAGLNRNHLDKSYIALGRTQKETFLLQALDKEKDNQNLAHKGLAHSNY